MNCAECRDNLVACLEGVLDNEHARQCRAHLESCEPCRTEYAALGRLQERLTARGRVAADISLVESVMRAVHKQQTEPERTTLMSLLLKNRWGFGLGAAASAAAIILLIALTTPSAQAKAVKVMTKGAQAISKLTSIHLRGQLRTLPGDNFSNIDPGGDFYTVELWKQFEPDLKWRAEKPGRIVLMDGQQVINYMKQANIAYKLAVRTSSAFDTDWLQRIANLSNTISNELRNAQAQGWKLGLSEETGADGRVKSIVTVHAKCGLPEDDYTRDKFLGDADTRRVYRFDAQTERLEAVQMYLVKGGSEVQIFDLSRIDYDQPIDPSVWQLQLPADVSWVKDPQKLPDNAKYASMTPEQAARAFFDACAQRDWEEAGKFMSPINQRLKDYLGGLEIVSLGQAFSSKAYGGRFVPYEIKLRPQEVNVRVSNNNPAKRYVITGTCDSQGKLHQELAWTNAPAVLPDNDPYAKLSPVDAVKAYCAAQSKLDWAEMKKFAPDYDVERDRRRMQEAQKRGVDVSTIMPQVAVGEAVWSPEQSAYLVKCYMSGIKKHNLALRKDNQAGRWQVDGGI